MPDEEIIISGNAHIPLIATQRGYKNWRSLWSQNSDLQGERKNPFILFHGDKNPNYKHQDDNGKDVNGAAGDKVVVPETKKKEESGSTNAHHPFEVGKDDVYLRLRVLNEEWSAIKNASYELYVDGVRFPSEGAGEFDADGMINEKVPKTAQVGKLIVTYKPPKAQEKASEEVGVVEGTSGGAGEGVKLIYRDGRKCKHYSQGDSRWGSDDLGNENRTISQAGCAISCVAMVLDYFGRTVNPGTLDKYLDKNNGYSGNAVKWNVAYECGAAADLPKVSRGSVIKDAGQFSKILDERIDKNLPTIARVDYGRDKDNRYNHFVVIVGKTKDGYIMNDPGTRHGDGASDPSNENIVELTSRKKGYEMVQLDLVDAEEEAPDEEAGQAEPPVAEAPEEEEGDEDEGEEEARPIEVVFYLDIGRLDPIQEKAPDEKCVSGIQQRLNNLGFDSGQVDGFFGSNTESAIKRFQRRFKLKITGQPDAETQKALYDYHDQPGKSKKKEEADEGAGTPKDGETPPGESDDSKDEDKEDSPYSFTLDEGEALEKELRDKHPDYGTDAFNGYGSGPDQYVCTTYAVEVLKRSGYNITPDISGKINITGIGKDEDLEQLVKDGDDRIKGVVTALVGADMGTEVDIADLKEGDFVQYWYYYTSGGEKKLAGHTGQVGKVNSPGNVDFHGAHSSKKGLGYLRGLNLNSDKRTPYGVRPKGNT